MNRKVIISCAITGSRTAGNNVPITPEQQAEDIVKIARAGAAQVHIHARDENGVNTMSPDRWVEIFTLSRKRLAEEGLDIIFNPTSAGRGYTAEERVAHLPFIMPEMTSYDVGTLNWTFNSVAEHSPEFLDKCARACLELKIKPEIEIFSAGMIDSANYWIEQGLIAPPPYFQFVLGVGGGMEGTAENMAYLQRHLPKGALWSASGVGKAHLPVLLSALAMGADGVRCGMEDNVYMDRGVPATNEQLVIRTVEFCLLANREIATAAEAREILGLVKHI